jgi:diguanylate cyclase (GGDEF)-like protein
VTQGGDVVADLAAQPATAARRLSGPRAPFQVLALWMLASAGIVAFFFAFPGSFEIARGLEMRVGVALIVVSGFTWLVAPHLPGELWLDVCIIAAGVIAAVAVAGVPNGEGQLTIGIGLLALGMFAAYYRTSRRQLADMIVCVGLFLLATLVNPRLSTPFLALVWCVIIVGTGYAFSLLVTRLRNQALHDNLTGLLNRHGLSLLAPPVVAGARRAHLDVTICVLDLDDFKSFNDSHGHLAGDALLVTATEAVTGTARDSDLVVRWGGDELVLVLIGASPAVAEELQSRAVAVFETTRPPHWKHAWTCGSTQLRPTESVESAIERADEELIARKRAARLRDQRT